MTLNPVHMGIVPVGNQRQGQSAFQPESLVIPCWVCSNREVKGKEVERTSYGLTELQDLNRAVLDSDDKEPKEKECG